MKKLRTSPRLQAVLFALRDSTLGEDASLVVKPHIVTPFAIRTTIGRLVFEVFRHASRADGTNHAMLRFSTLRRDALVSLLHVSGNICMSIMRVVKVLMMIINYYIC